jgi:hypothetical protein
MNSPFSGEIRYDEISHSPENYWELQFVIQMEMTMSFVQTVKTTMKSAFPVAAVLTASYAVDPSALEAQRQLTPAQQAQIDAIKARRNSSTAPSGIVVVGGNPYTVTTQIGGLTSTAVVTDADGKLVGKAHMATADIANGGKLVIESPPIGDPNFNIVGQAVVAIIKMKQGAAPSLELVADDKTQTTAQQLNGQTGGNGDPRAAQRALLQQQADAANANALRLAGRQGVVIPGHEGDRPGIKVQFTQEGNQITQVVVTDNIGDITLNADATQIQFKDTVGKVQMTYSEIGKGHAVGKAIGGLSGGAVSGGGSSNSGRQILYF